MSILPEGEDLRKAVQWIAQMRRDEPELSLKKRIEQACLKFNLSPRDAIFLERYVREQEKP